MRPVSIRQSVRAHVQVEKEVVKAIRQMEEVEMEVKKKKEVSSRVKQLRRQVSLTPLERHDLFFQVKKTLQGRLLYQVYCGHCMPDWRGNPLIMVTGMYAILQVT